MDTLIKVNNQTAGRDKIARLLQYLTRFVWHRLQQSNKNGVSGLKNLEFQLSTFRKLLRFGRCIDTIYSILPLLQHDDSAVRYTVVLSKLFNALFLFADHILWLGRADVSTVNTEKWSRISNKYWLYSITMNLLRDFYEISVLLKANRNSLVPKNGIKSPSDVLTTVLNVTSILQRRPNVVIDTIKNGCDFFIPLTALGYSNLKPGTIGLLGVVSSLAALAVIIEPKTKLAPS